MMKKGYEDNRTCSNCQWYEEIDFPDEDHGFCDMRELFVSASGHCYYWSGKNEEN